VNGRIQGTEKLSQNLCEEDRRERERKYSGRFCVLRIGNCDGEERATEISINHLEMKLMFVYHFPTLVQRSLHLLSGRMRESIRTLNVNDVTLPFPLISPAKAPGSLYWWWEYIFASEPTVEKVKQGAGLAPSQPLSSRKSSFHTHNNHFVKSKCHLCMVILEVLIKYDLPSES